MNARELHELYSEYGIRTDVGSPNQTLILRALDLLARMEESKDELVRELREEAVRQDSGLSGGETAELLDEAAAALVALQYQVTLYKTENVALKAERDDYKARCAIDDSERESRRQSLANEIRDTLKTRGFYAPARPSDLIGAVALALEKVMAERDGLKAHAEAMAFQLNQYASVNDALVYYRRDFPRDAPHG